MNDETEISNRIRFCLDKKQGALSEFESKKLLSSYDVPVTKEVIATGPESAVAEAIKIGFPVALKASGKSFYHKTELAGVVLYLRNEYEVQLAAEKLLNIKGCEALLVQEMIYGDRELLCGLKRDEQFNVCLMFGLGGILTEILNDFTFRIAPITLWDAEEMITEIRGKKILGPFRGQAAVNATAVAQVLVNIAQVGLENTNVVEIDINPLKIKMDGNPVAVDALVVLKTCQTK